MTLTSTSINYFISDECTVNVLPNDEPVVTIIINNYNYGQFLEDAINSALAQDYNNVHVIVVDDGSTDRSREIITGYGEHIVAILKSNEGQASALNAGFAKNTGDLVIFLDADDVLLPDTARRVADTFRANPGLAKVQYRMEVIDVRGERTGTIKPHRHLPMRSGDLRRYVLAFPFDMAWTATSGNAFATEVLRQIFPIPEHVYGRVGADWYISHLTPLFGTVHSLEDIGAYYRVHGSNNYEVSEVNLHHVRQTIHYWRSTQAYIRQYAQLLGLVDPADAYNDVPSVAYVSNRLISLKLDPKQHPIEDDRLWRLLLLGVTASAKRFDVSFIMKCMFLLWFAAITVAPKPVALWLATKFLFPETRGAVNRVLGMLHRDR